MQRLSQESRNRARGSLLGPVGRSPALGDTLSTDASCWTHLKSPAGETLTPTSSSCKTGCSPTPPRGQVSLVGKGISLLKHSLQTKNPKPLLKNVYYNLKRRLIPRPWKIHTPDIWWASVSNATASVWRVKLESCHGDSGWGLNRGLKSN